MLRRLLDSPWTYFGLAGLLAILAVASQLRLHVTSRPSGTAGDIAKLRERDDTNVVFILVDTLRADRLSSYGYARKTSELLDSLAASGVRFARVEAQSSWTKASMASLWTSLYPVRTGVTRFSHALPPDAVLPAERLREVGFRTAGFWRNGWVANNFGFDQGFESYYQPKPGRSPDKVQRRGPGEAALQGTDLDATEAALEFLRAYGHERFFLYLHYMDVHQYLFDQVAGDEGYGTKLGDAYDAAIHWTDRNVGRLVRELDDRDLFGKTLVVIAADHGEGFYEHGHEGHATTLYGEVTNVPLILALPFRLEAPVVVEPLVRNVDIWPTLYDLLGLPPAEPSDGRSLVPLIEAAARGEAPAEGDAEPPAYSYLDQTWGKLESESAPMLSVRTANERFLFYPATTKRPDLVELYDHREDPLEKRTLASELPERVKELEADARAHLGQSVAWGKPLDVEVDDMRLNQLRALGYVLDADKKPELEKPGPRRR